LEGKTRATLVWIAVGLMLVLSVASASALGADYVVLGTVPIVPKGVTLLGHDLSGMNDAEVRAAIDENVSTPAMQPLTVSGDGKSWTLDPKGIVTVDVEDMVEQAYAPARNAVLAARLSSWAGGEPLTGVVKPSYAVDKTTLAGWVRDAAATVDRVPVDATRTVAGHAIQITPEVYGASVDQAKAVETLAQALTDEAGLESASRVASLPVDVIEPKVVQTKFKTAIVVSLAKCMVYLYDGAQLVKSYPCAPGRAAFPTPKGDFVIQKKLANSPWYNPHSDWSASMPDVIPPGPSNPMGVRKIGINYPGVFLHGIPRSEYSSIGTHASHGCMRMMPSAILDLYGRVKVGDPVYIRN
jgi:lipoprotein-anchoring transpeptidase ErfK/SrfK